MSTTDSASTWIDLLRRSGDRITPARRAVAAALAGSPRPLGATEILDWARQWCPSLGLVTVYRTVERLQALGLVQRVHGSESCHSYIAIDRSRPFSVSCVRCGATDFFDSRELSLAIAQAVGVRDFLISELTCQIIGVCQRCRTDTLHTQTCQGEDHETD